MLRQSDLPVDILGQQGHPGEQLRVVRDEFSISISQGMKHVHGFPEAIQIGNKGMLHFIDLRPQVLTRRIRVRHIFVQCVAEFLHLPQVFKVSLISLIN